MHRESLCFFRQRKWPIVARRRVRYALLIRRNYWTLNVYLLHHEWQTQLFLNNSTEKSYTTNEFLCTCTRLFSITSQLRFVQTTVMPFLAIRIHISNISVKAVLLRCSVHKWCVWRPFQSWAISLATTSLMSLSRFSEDKSGTWNPLQRPGSYNAIQGPPPPLGIRTKGASRGKLSEAFAYLKQHQNRTNYFAIRVFFMCRTCTRKREAAKISCLSAFFSVEV